MLEMKAFQLLFQSSIEPGVSVSIIKASLVCKKSSQGRAAKQELARLETLHRR